MQDDTNTNNPHYTSSSLASSGTPSMPLPCVISSEIPTSRPIFDSDRPSSPSQNSRRFRLPLPNSAASATAPSSYQSMGQNQSTAASTSSTSQRLKRAFGRKRKPEDVVYQGEGIDRMQSPPPSPMTPASPSVITRHFTLFGHRKASLTSSTSPNLSSSLPPTHKSVALRPATRTQAPIDEHPKPVIINRSGISASVQVIRQEEDGNRAEEAYATKLETEKKNQWTEQVKEDWRKSDSTMTSRHTIRPGAGTSKNARPVSVAESSHSTSTIVAVSKRVSVLMADAELITTEDRESDVAPAGVVAISRVQSPASPSPTQHRRSISLKLGTVLSFTSRPELQVETSGDSELVAPSRSKGPLPVSYKADTLPLAKIAANGLISPPNSHTSASQPVENKLRGPVAAWVTASSPPPSSPHLIGPTGHLKGTTTFRQTAVSISGSIAPAAMDLGKRAMERVGRAWGSRGAGSSSGYVSSSSEQSSSSSKRRAVDPAMRRYPSDSISSQISSFSSSVKGKRRTPNAPSGSWSIASSTASSTSVLDVDPCPALSAINSSKCLRGPISSSGSLVFGRKLAECVRDTAIDVVRSQLISGEYFGEEAGDDLYEGRPPFAMRPLEQRLLPAVVVRCAQHLITWGVQEEGLFRMNGRSSHIRELRGEFDQGVDYDISGCAPYDIDPHVVSSLFKLYLREMPEPLLTSELMPYFDAVMATEDSPDAISILTSRSSATASGSSLSMRKPPSLSTLAMPNLAGMRSFSHSSLQAISALVSKLPRENRDLLFTVTELIKATASRSKETKMPLANLLLVFCPSLNMKPTLLRILCESDDIWSCPPDAVETSIPVISGLNQPPINSREGSVDSIDDNPSPDGSKSGHTVGARRGVKRGPIATLYGKLISSTSLVDVTRTSPDSMSYRDDSSEPSLSEASRTRNLVTRSDSPPLSSSVESLVTPSSSSEMPSFEFSHTKTDPYTTPLVTELSQFSLRTSPRPIISSPVPFPSSAGNPPTTILSSKSFPNLHMPVSDPSSESRRTTRRSRPSLNLFSQKSVSSLRSLSSTISAPLPYLSPSPIGEIKNTASPPVLNTPISSSPIHLGFEGSSPSPDSGPKVAPILTKLQSTSSTATDSPTSALYATPAGSSSSIPSPITAEPEGKRLSFIRSASRLSIAIGGDEVDDDWTRSVLEAVDIDKDQLPANNQT